MRYVPTRAMMTPGDPELIAAQRRLAVFLADAGGAPLLAIDAPAPTGSWRYRCSIPRRDEDGAILYFHTFEGAGRIAGGSVSLAVAASPGWWPVGCLSLAPLGQTQRRAALRLVS